MKTKDYGLKELHSALGSILIDVDRVCRQHNIKYSLFAGTLLGAIRHRGFIPWDDDVDICFAREQYEKFVKIYDRKKDKKFNFQHVKSAGDKLWPNDMLARVWLPKPQLLLSNSQNFPGPWVAIFVFDAVPNGAISSRIKVFLVKLLIGMSGKPRTYDNLSVKRRVFFSVNAFLGKLFTQKWLNKTHKRISRWGAATSNYVTTYNVRSYLIRKKFPREILRGYSDVMFEGNLLMAMDGYDECLTYLYGDYMVPPPENQRVAKHI